MNALHDLASIPGLRVERRVAGNALATVHQAWLGDQKVALKVYHRLALSEDGQARIRRERQVQRQLAHVSVARLLDWGLTSNGSAFSVSEWIEGACLEDRLLRGPMSWIELVPIVQALAGALHAVHAAGIVHRDVKPSNVMLPQAPARSRAVLLDFGHSLILCEDRLTERGLTLGTAAYMAPEQAAGCPLDGRADLYALGVLLYRALTGAVPFEATSAAEMLRLHQVEPVLPPRKRAPGQNIPAAAEDLCLWLLAKDPAARVPNARVLGITLLSIGNSERQEMG